MYYSWRYKLVDTVDSTPEDTHVLLDWKILFINIYTVYVIEPHVAKCFLINHSTKFPRALTGIIISNHKETGVCVNAF